MGREPSGTLAKFAVLLGGPMIWFVHLGLVYGGASLGLTLTFGAPTSARLFIAAATLVSLAAIAWIAREARRGRLPRWESPQEDLAQFWRKATFLLCLLSFFGVLWQGLPALLVAGGGSHQALFGGTNQELDLP